ncbi:unnamed protein product [Calicophoron daubneyi]|uniref:GBD/FH3 domain-containing protein n=1 Tax=Calicophoron daubneyi TaxID=300641 RepID=A0AAV2T772_CALDB
MSVDQNETVNFPTWLTVSLEKVVQTQVIDRYLLDLSEGMELLPERSQGSQVILKKLGEILSKNLRMEVERRLIMNSPNFTDGLKPQSSLSLWSKRVTEGIHPPISSLVGMTSRTFPSRADLLAVEAREGVIALVTKHPSLCAKLALRLFGQPLQGSAFRRQIWHLVLANQRVNVLYTDMMKDDIVKTMSVQDQTILRQCVEYLDNEPTMTSLKDSVGCIHAIKAILSFFHMTLNSVDDLRNSQIRIAAALVLAMSDYLPRQKPPNFEELVILIEEFFSIVSQMPNFLTKQPRAWFQHYRPCVEKATQVEDELVLEETRITASQAAFGAEVLQRLRTLDSDVASKVLDEIVAVRGFLSRGALLFVWDQIIFCMASQAPLDLSLNFLLSSVAAIFLYLAWLRGPRNGGFQYITGESVNAYFYSVGTDTEKDRVETVTEVSTSTEFTSKGELKDDRPKKEEERSPVLSLNERFKLVGAQIQMEDIKFLIKKHFFSDMFYLLSGSERYPPTSADLTPTAESTWSEWFHLLDEDIPGASIERGQNRLLRIEELQKLKDLEERCGQLSTEIEKRKQELQDVRKDATCTSDRLRENQKRQKQLADSTESWKTVVRNLEKKLANANKEVEMYRNAAAGLDAYAKRTGSGGTLMHESPSQEGVRNSQS